MPVHLTLLLQEGVDAEFALVVTGTTLRYALEDSLKYTFLDLALQCAAVICCRVTPLQKVLLLNTLTRRQFICPKYI